MIPAQGHSVGRGGGGSLPGLRPKRRGLLSPARGRSGAHGHCGWRAQDGVAAGGTPVLGGQPGPPTEYHGCKGVPLGRLRRGGTHRFNAAMVRWCGGSVRRRAAVSLPEKGLMAVLARSQSCGEGRER
jgi:hypothetical protein